MIDYTKMVVPREHREMLQAVLDFRRAVNEDTGEVATSRSRVAQFGPPIQGRNGITDVDPLRKAMQFHMTPTGQLLLDGSWHKQAQEGANHGAFTLPQFRETVAGLCTPFGLDPSRMDLQVLEAGVNITLPFKVKDVLGRLVCHREGVPFTPMRSKRGRSLGLELVRGEYTLKFYDKGGQYGLPLSLLRVEVKFTKSRRFHPLGIRTLADLFHADRWQALADALLALFDEIIIEEPHVNMDALTLPEQRLAQSAGDHRYWANLGDKERHRARQRYQRIVQEHAPHSLKVQLRAAIIAACAALRESQPSTNGEVLTMSPVRENGEVFTACAMPENGEVLTAHLSVVNTTPFPNEVEENHPSVMGENLPIGHTAPPPRYCPWCGRDITHQRARSNVCSEWRYGREGKRCRNALSNRTRDLTRIEKRGPRLFDHIEFLRPLGPRKPPNRSAA